MKRILSLLTVLLIASLILSSCHNARSEADLYDVLINEEVRSLNNINADKYDKFTMNEKQYVNDIAEKGRATQILGESYDLTYSHSTSSSFVHKNLDYYSNEKLNCKMVFSTETKELLQIVSNNVDGVIIPTEVSVSSTENYFSWLRNVIKNTLGIDVSGYTLSCKTYYLDHTFENSFITSSPSNEKQVSDYYVEYTKYVGQYKSGEMIRVILQPDGSINSLVHFQVPTSDFEALSISEDKLNRTIEKTVHNIGASKYTVKSYTVNSMLLEIYEGKPYLLCGVKIISTDRSGEEVSSAVILAVSLETTAS